MHFALEFQGVQAAIWRAFGVWDGAFRTGFTATSRLPAMFLHFFCLFRRLLHGVRCMPQHLLHLLRRWHFNKSCISRIPLPCGPFFWRHGEQILMDCHRHLIRTLLISSCTKLFPVVSLWFQLFQCQLNSWKVLGGVGRCWKDHYLISLNQFDPFCQGSLQGEMVWLILAAGAANPVCSTCAAGWGATVYCKPLYLAVIFLDSHITWLQTYPNHWFIEELSTFVQMARKPGHVQWVVHSVSDRWLLMPVSAQLEKLPLYADDSFLGFWPKESDVISRIVTKLT